MNKPDICIFHAYCPDGFGAAYAIWKRFGSDVEFRHGSYGTPPPSNVTDKHVLLVDFSYKEPVLREMAKTAASITVLDHHKTAEADLKPLFDEGLITGVFDMQRSGAGLAWDWAFPDTDIPWALRFVEDRDLWRFRYGEDTKNFCARLDVEKQDFASWDLIIDITEWDSGRRDFIAEGELLRRKFLKDCDSLIASTLHFVRIGEHRVPCCNVPHIYASEVGNILAKRDDAPFSATFYVNKEGDNVYSLRSTEEKVDVSEIAKIWGGGGHRCASGLRLKGGMSFKRDE